MTDKLPPQLLALFTPRPPLRWVPPVDHAPEERRTAPVSGVAQFLAALQDYKDKDGYVKTESWLQRRDRKALEKKAEEEKRLTEAPKNYKPSEDPNIRGDAFKTMIVARLSYEANEQDLEREFSRYGPIERIRIVKDTHANDKGNKKRKPHRGYAFVVFEREKDMRAALELCDGIRIKDRRIKVDVERGRTVKGWKPRRFGGGLGGRGYTKAASMQSARGGPPGSSGGGPPGGFRSGGGFRGSGLGGGGGRDRSGGGGFRGARGGDRFDRGPHGGDRYEQNGGPPASNGSAYGRSDRRDGDRIGSGAHEGRDDRSGGYRDRDRDRDRGYDGDRDRDRDYGRRDRDRRGDRERGSEGRRTGSNMEPIRPRGENGGYRGGSGGGGGDSFRDGGDRSRGGGGPGGDDSRKRGFDGPPYDETRKIRRYQ